MIVVFTEKDGSRIKKASLEALAFGQDLALQTNAQCIAAVIGDSTEVDLGKYGANKVVVVKGDGLETFSPEGYSNAVVSACRHVGATTVVIPATYSGKSIAPKIAVNLGGSCTMGVIELPRLDNGFMVKKSCFSNKAFTDVSITSPIKILGIIPNSYEVREFNLTATIETIESSFTPKVKSLSVDKVMGKIPLTEAELVVSAGRGLKGPENWGMIEELAEILNAATACSKPVADMDWRPHAEHVGQTGITIKPNLYMAIGISGAIQHLAGVSSSKVICVVNTDPDAPFFKVADYGIVGDAFEVVPKLISRARELKSS